MDSAADAVVDTGIGFIHRDVTIDGLAQLPGTADIGLGGAPVLAADGAVVGAIFALPSRDQRILLDLV